MKLARISDVSKDLGITSRTLRYYEETGLVYSTRLPDEKYRYFDEENLERIKQIVVLRKMQIPVKDIITIYDNRDMSILVEVFTKRV